MLLGDIIGFNLKLISSSSLNLYVKLFSDMQVCETNALILNDSLAPPPRPISSPTPRCQVKTS